ncbi:DUF4105 domain-containing protein [Rapidithrix thailandica]|uniref:DUF4105 domain-containing protein n=1 Tax=Rapidithrix thailandica TaxID=413964 RepID=A0AAW9RWM6_9BACT
MKRYLFIVFFFCISFNGTQGQSLPDTVSEKAIISLLTCEEGEELYAAFGHSALRVRDSLTGIDVVFNYGTFNFREPNFYGKFVQGQLLYFLSTGSFQRFLQSYQADNRGVTEQVLNLDTLQTKELYAKLLVNLKPENKYYKYDFFYDNCTTRLWELIKPENNEDKAEEISPEATMSFRDYIHPYLESKPWVRFGIDILLGQPTDLATVQNTAQFLPDNLMHTLEYLEYGTKPVVKATVQLFESKPVNQEESQFIPYVFFWGLFGGVLVLFAIEVYFNLHFHWIDRLLYLSTGLIGCLIVYLWFISDHQATNQNLHLLWAFPVNLYFVFFPKKKTLYHIVYGLAITGLLLGFPWLPQNFPVEVIPVLLVLLLRLVRLAMSEKKKKGNIKYSMQA